MISYETFKKHAEKVTKSAQSIQPHKPVLTGIYYTPDRNLVVTDSHRLYIAKNMHVRGDGAVITPAGKEIKGNYPDVTRLIPDRLYAKQEFRISVKEIMTAADLATSAGSLEAQNPSLTLKGAEATYNGAQIKMKYELAHDFEPICLNALYLLDALKMFKAAGCESITYRFYGSMRPFTLSSEDDNLLALILPVRKY